MNGTIEIAGPERAPLSEFVGRFLKAANDPREVVADAQAPYFGLELDDRSLVPGDNPRVGATRFDVTWTTRAGDKEFFPGCRLTPLMDLR